MWSYDMRWRGLLALGLEQEFSQGKVLVPWDRELGHVVALTRGVVKAAITTPNGLELPLAKRKPPCVLGDLSALKGGHSSAEVTAITHGTAVHITARAFTGYVDSLGVPRPILAEILDWTYGMDLKRAQERILPLRSRVADFLLDVAGEVPSERLEGWERERVADFFGVSDRTLRDNALKPLVEAGAIALGKRCCIQIINEAALRREIAKLDDF
ncbi:hypothetical protein ADK75_02475 [Streptomyces virginiae]|uniref:Cyclic nucleotide-binding domain-containing protein n=1 Tax=Streptomyces virginiae TaxID=1961 RepID=A0A0L8N6Y4_STRVG|nr:cyclic nucleotide-binding domain-containing protein [Streptomyces virginiae]KOG58250.1 hypothetical protein ADK75_02475 [Streptomyces virginiae]